MAGNGRICWMNFSCFCLSEGRPSSFESIHRSCSSRFGGWGKSRGGVHPKNHLCEKNLNFIAAQMENQQHVLEIHRQIQPVVRFSLRHSQSDSIHYGARQPKRRRHQEFLQWNVRGLRQTLDESILHNEFGHQIANVREEGSNVRQKVFGFVK